MGCADEDSYQEMINTLTNFKREVEERRDRMEDAGRDCVDNTDNDPAAEKSNEKLQKCLRRITEELYNVDRIIVALREEIESAREAANKAN